MDFIAFLLTVMIFGLGVFIISSWDSLFHKHEYQIKAGIQRDGSIEVISCCKKCDKVFSKVGFTTSYDNWKMMGTSRGYTSRYLAEEIYREQRTQQQKSQQKKTQEKKASPQPSSKGWWTVLGVNSDASANEIQQAYRKLARRHHPDMGGDAVKMAIINAARDEGLRAKAA